MSAEEAGKASDTETAAQASSGRAAPATPEPESAPGLSAPPVPPAAPGERTFTRADFHYDLPERLIAQTPTAERTASRLLVLTDADAGDTAALEHRNFAELPALLEPGDLLVVNDTRVIKARLEALKDTGGRAEVLLERMEADNEALCQVRASKALKTGRTLSVGDATLTVLGRAGSFYHLAFSAPVLEVLERYGAVPLPPYIEREATTDDEDRYQTVWNRTPGAVAAPTAGLHFSEALLDALEEKGVRRVAVTLHVGAGTFQPMRSEELDGHEMHEERFHIDPAAAEAIRTTAAAGGRIVAVGTTVVRALEAAAVGPYEVKPGAGVTQLFITPGYEFKVVDRLITNFHLPASTLLMLVSAFAGYERIMQAYEQAVAAEYRFFSYGDAMLLTTERP
ncbi:MAG: tRNA preQ1(34) S-adenosylmethionine ribosyltransferase-isomerase QueA [Pseudomonadota bacterium]